MGKIRFLTPFLEVCKITFLVCFSGLTYSQEVALHDWLADSGLKYQYFADFQEFQITGDSGKFVRFGILSPYSYFSGIGFKKTGFLVNKGSEFYLTTDLYINLKKYFDNPSGSIISPKIVSIVLDAGHGGKDQGAVVTYYKDGHKIQIKEKDIVLRLVKKVQKILVKEFPNTNIILTRNDDIYLTLDERVEIANVRKPEFPNDLLFISLHANYSPNKKARGFEVWSLPDKIEREVMPLLDPHFKKNWQILNSFMNLRYKEQSRLLAHYILEAYKSQFDNFVTRGLKEESWFVVKNTHMPAVLIEVGFISHEEEAFHLLEEKYLDKLSYVIYQGIKRFIDEYSEL